jgi:hypothetical protein
MTQSDRILAETPPAPPVGPLGYYSPSPENIWRDGMMFVISPRSVLPARCLKCNADAGGSRISKKISPLSAWYPLFSSAGWNSDSVHDWPVYIVFSLCWWHRLRWLGRMSVVGIMGLANLFCFTLYKKEIAALGPVTNVLAILLPLLFVVFALSLRPIIRPRRVHQGLAWFAGAGREFLNSLPELNARTAPGSQGIER